MNTSVHTGRHATGAALILVTAVLVFSVAPGAAQAGDAYLGITMSSISSSMARALKLDEGTGVLVDRVVAGSPAEAAGLESGDVILQIDERPVAAMRDLTRHLQGLQPGEEVKLAVQREGKRRQLKVTLGERPRRQVDRTGNILEDMGLWRWLDAEEGDGQNILKDLGLTSLVQGWLGVETEDAETGKGKAAGARIKVVVKDSPAALAGLEVGDVITAIDEVSIDSATALQSHMETTRPGDRVKVKVQRDGKSQDMTIALAGMAERFGLAELIRQYKDQDGSSPDSAWSFTWPKRPPQPPRPPRPPASPDQLASEREDLQDLKAELEELKHELQKLREELQKKQPQQQR